ncbi:DUF998 domain-containing protein [Kineosporia sp. A_224]|uniref:DUF998 domain-containing protein n=1 Tax=Kineosporia sp. A_224 TaxID=1962180 RepID=UPI000B4BFBDF|nr:DUF998 domain-containing protein [Kineosporia sp. A_224]
MPAPRRFDRAALTLGLGVPVLYFLTQGVIGVLTPGYSFRQQAASDLGVGDSARALVFNLGAVSTGVLAAVAAYGFAAAPRWSPVPAVRARLTALAVASTGAAAIAAGVFPLPDPRHGGGPIGAGMFVIPLLMATLLWRVASPWARAYLVLNLALFAGCAAMLSGSTPVDQVANGGLLQRLLAVTVFGAIGIGCAIVTATRPDSVRSDSVQVGD